MPSDPAAIGGAPKDIILAVIKDPLERLLGPDVVARSRVADALWLSRRTTGVQNERTCFAV